MSLVSLNTLSVGEQAYVNKLGFGANDRRRMQDIGLIDGTRVECLGKAISGDPAAYLIRGAVIALRSDAKSAMPESPSAHLLAVR